MAEASRTQVFDVSLDALWDVITDYKSYPKFVEGLKDLKVLEEKENEVVAEYKLDMMGKQIRYVVRHKEKPKKSLEWTMVEGEFFKSNDGSWKLKAVGKDQVEATYSLAVGFPLLVPKMIVNTLVGTQLPSMMKAFEDRAKKVGGKKKGK
jgi:coenzyme Q-binding protein COQ10